MWEGGIRFSLRKGGAYPTPAPAQQTLSPKSYASPPPPPPPEPPPRELGDLLLPLLDQRVAHHDEGLGAMHDQGRIAQVAVPHVLVVPRLGHLAAGFRVRGSGFRVQGSGFRVQGSGFGVQGGRKHEWFEARSYSKCDFVVNTTGSTQKDHPL